MMISLTRAEAAAVYKALEKMISMLRPEPDDYIRQEVKSLQKIEQKIEDAFLAE